MEKLAKAIIKLRWPIIIVVVLLTSYLAYQIKDIKINSDVVSALPDDDPDVVLFKRIGKDFGGNKIGMIILETNNVFTNKVLADVREITDSVSQINGVSSVTSLTNILDIKNDELGFEVGKLVDEYSLPYSGGELKKLNKRALSNDMFRGVIVSEDGTATVIMFTMTNSADIQTVGRVIIDKVESLHLKEKIYYAGMPMMVT